MSNRKLSNDQVKEIRKQIDNGERLTTIAKSFNINESQVSRIGANIAFRDPNYISKELRELMGYMKIAYECAKAGKDLSKEELANRIVEELDI